MAAKAFLFWIRSAALGVALVVMAGGCGLTQSSKADKGGASWWKPQSGNPQTPPAPVVGDPIKSQPNFDPSPSVNASGILAGQLLDDAGRPVPHAVISVRLANPEAGQSSEPIQAESDSQGNFSIYKLKPRSTYTVSARSVGGDRKLAGLSQAQPPNTKVYIRMREDLVSPQGVEIGRPTPTPMGPATPPEPDWTGGDKSDAPAKSTPPAPASGLSIPAGPSPPSRPELVAPSGKPLIRSGDMRGNWQNNKPTPISPQSYRPNGNSAVQPAFGQLTSCRADGCMTGGRIEHLALHGLDGKLWDLREHRRGKLVLLDFWGTWCVACMKATPEIVRLQKRYGSDLEVIGIACEKAPLNDRVRRVRHAEQILQLNYRVLLAGDIDRCEVLTTLKISEFPTLILIDENGRILWRDNHLYLRDLEQQLRRLLPNR